jgi:hypothetical protein
MAKSTSIINLQGTVDEITFVKSRAYGNHIRAARGTHKKAEVNEAFKKESKRLLSANIPAKIFKDAIDPYRDVLKGGLLWQRLISMFRKQLQNHGSFDFSDIEPFEIHTDYSLERFLIPRPRITFDQKQSVLHVNMSYDKHPRFSRSSFIDGYMLSVIGIFPDLKKKTAKSVVVNSPIRPLTGKVAPLRVQLVVPPKAKSYVVCLKIEGCMKEVVNNTAATQGLRVIGAGAI